MSESRQPPRRDPLPAWLGTREASPARAPAPGPFWLGLLVGLFAAGALAAGWLAWWKAHQLAPPVVTCPAAPAMPLPLAPPCAPAASANPPPAQVTTRPAPPAHHAHAKVGQPAVSPLPPDAVPEESKRREDLRAFATSRAAELKTCILAPNRGPVRRVGAALVIDAAGNVAAVQILGANIEAPAAGCYAERLRRWRFPAALLRGQERLLVNFVL